MVYQWTAMGIFLQFLSFWFRYLCTIQINRKKHKRINKKSTWYRIYQVLIISIECIPYSTEYSLMPIDTYALNEHNYKVPPNSHWRKKKNRHFLHVQNTVSLMLIKHQAYNFRFCFFFFSFLLISNSPSAVRVSCSTGWLVGEWQI